MKSKNVLNKQTLEECVKGCSQSVIGNGNITLETSTVM